MSGDGTIYRLPNGRWCATLDLPLRPDGRRHRVSRRAKTKVEARRILQELKAELSTHSNVPQHKRKLSETLNEYFTMRSRSKVAKSTLARDEIILRRVTTFFAAKRTADLTVQDCDALLEAFANGTTTPEAEMVSVDYIRRVRSFLSNALKNDMRLGHINRNVAQVAVTPDTHVEKRQRRALTHQQWLAIYEKSDGNLKLVIDLGGRHGLRPQEIRALCWPQIDLDQQTLSVVTQLDSNDQFVDTKTIGSVRTIQIHPETAEHLRQSKASKPRSSTASTYEDLLVRTRNGTPLNQGNLRRDLKALCRRVQLPELVPYELRHTAITHQIEAGFTASQVADWAGTSEKMIYDHYRHKLREVNSLPPVKHA